ncbi:MAG: family 78 glycoside hydrolase catalytic domain [Polaribacter sp.]|uniref:family 78 glycoside hydrolase catalytic domain n=1 Tax=Polaribacter sp. TaxID=1920175 RepID=UPI003266BAAE
MTKFLLSVFLLFFTFQYVEAQNDALAEPNLKTELMNPVKIIEVKKGHYFIDFGKAFFGTVTLSSKKSQKDTLIIHLGEQLSHKNTINKNPKGTIRYQQAFLPFLDKEIQTDVILTADKRNTNKKAIQLPSSFGTVMPFRYCEIENLKIPINEIEISQKALLYSFNDRASSFQSSDTILNQIWNLCKHTIKATTFTGYYVDGDRERIPYEADAYINQLSHYAVDNEYSMARRTNEYFITHPTWPTEWILHTAKMFYYDYLYTGDTKSIKKYYDKLKAKTLIQLAREDGLISTHSSKLNKELMHQLGFKNGKQRIKDIVDWPKVERDGYEFKEVNTVINSFYYENLQFMSLIAKAIRKRKDAKFYKKEADKIKKIINTKLFDSTKGIYIDGEGSTHSSLHANMFPLAFGLVPKENLETVIGFVKSKGMACSVYGAQYLLEGLYRNNEAEYAKQLIVDTTNVRTWWNMIKVGSTMTLESWDIKVKSNLDWNHAWGTAPANIITRNMWGIKPVSPGFGKAEITPQLTEISSSEITVPTIKGSIKAKFKKLDDGSELYEILLPKKMNVVFRLPYKKYKRLIVNGKVINKSKKIKLKKRFNIINIRY